MAPGYSTSRKNAPIFLNPSYCFQTIFRVCASRTIPSSWRVNPPQSVVKNSFALISSFADYIKDANQKLEGLKCSSTLRNGQLSQCSRLFSSWHNMGSWDQPWIHQCRNKGFSFITFSHWSRSIDFIKEECQALCKNATACHGFTHHNANASPRANFCETFPTIHSSIPCSNCVSGPSSCFCSGEVKIQKKIFE